MKIRAITIGDNIPFLSSNENLSTFMEEKLSKFQKLNEDLIKEFKNVGLEVQTTRLCSQPLYPNTEEKINENNVKENLERLDNQFEIIIKSLETYNIDYFACCSMLADRLKNFGNLEDEILDKYPQYLLEYDSLFSSLNVASTNRGVNLSALKASTRIIKNLSVDPFKNLNFCVSFNVNPDLNVPFFPASYHHSRKPGFGLALEMADDVIEVIKKSKGINDIKKNLNNKFMEIYTTLTKISEEMASMHEVEFKGIDFSPAPFPKLESSIGNAVEQIGFDYFGAHGCSFGVALIKNAIPKNLDKIIGFSGFMQPVLEDFTIAKSLS
ncbi:MAG: DUF711 family protein, partial [Promethearchaeota archaeon]